jgi:flagellin-like protein
MSARRWTSRSRHDRGLAEIVGTLMLVLIVVSAAVAFSFFVASYQSQLQAQETLQHNQALESLHILSVAPSKPNATGVYDYLNFTLVSDYINPSYVTEIQINDQPLKQYEITDLNFTTGMVVHTPVPAGTYFELAPQQQVTVNINFTGPTASFYTPFVLTASQYVKIDVYTQLDNEFSRVFLPPTAIAVVSNTTTSTGTQTTLLDGSMSFQPEGNATVISWTWSITSPVLGFTNLTGATALNGEEVQTASPLSPTYNPYTVTLLVSNSDGLTGVTTLVYDA